MGNVIQFNNTKAGLPDINDLPQLDVTDREYFLARVLQEKKRRKTANILAARGLPDPVEWIEDNCWDASTVNVHAQDYSKGRKAKLEDFQKRIIRKILTINPLTGRFPYRTIVYSAPKKSGKSTIGSWITSYFAANVESPNAIYILANDREQSAGRVFGFAIPTLERLGAKSAGKWQYILPNGTLVQALTSDPSKEAGASYGLTVWDELWGYTSDRSRLLWDEMVPISTRNNSIRLVVTYAGFEDTSDLLLELYKKVFKDTGETELQDAASKDGPANAVSGLEDICTTDGKGNAIPCCYEVPKMALFYFNDHEQRMVWQRGEQGQALRNETEALMTETNAYRLIHNRWQMSESPFIDPDFIRQAETTKIASGPGTFAIDASERHDCTALVGTRVSPQMRYITFYATAWNPGGDDIDLEETVMSEILRLYRLGIIARRIPAPGEKQLISAEGLTPIDVHYDRYQMHQVAMNLRKKHKLLMLKFEQGIERLKADTFLQQQYKKGNIDIPFGNELSSHLTNAKAQEQTDAAENPRIRIVKSTGSGSKPIDLAVAQSMSVLRASEKPRIISLGGIAQGIARGWS